MQGKVERFHQTLKLWLIARPRTTTATGLQTQRDAFRKQYNQRRPHGTLDDRTPAHAYAATPKVGPAGSSADSVIHLNAREILATNAFDPTRTY
ncbi:integrase core domain-containing protein [Microbacterium gorillae]|uniref:integrase core domain-containing protein n=1 Tax=Microbacterium gorillae TaxID=1231063 RepID=UPI003D96DA78